jgi:glycerophosphoryl diester phosphodiesterase
MSCSRAIESLFVATPFANVECCTSDITLTEFRTLKGKRDGGNQNAISIEAYLAGTPGWIPNADSNSQLLDEYVSAGINPSRVFPQSFNLEGIRLCLQTAPEFGRQAVYLDGRYRDNIVCY